MRSVLRRLWRWPASRAWSRAGAIAAVLSAGAPRRVLVMSTRIALLVGGSVLISIAIALMLWNGFGPGPLDVFIVGLSSTTGLPLSVAVWAAFALMAGLAWLLGRRPGVGTLAAPLIIGPVVQATLVVLDGAAAPSGFVAGAILHVGAIGIAGVGAGALIVAGLGAGTGELLTTAASARTGRSESPTRFAIEFGWLVVGIALGGPIGPGTVLVAVLIGPSVAFGHRVVDRSVTHSRRRLGAAVPSRPVDPVAPRECGVR